MIKVPLIGKYKGRYALADDCDAWVLKFRWNGMVGRGHNVYAQASSVKGSVHSQLLHRLILHLKKVDPDVDHIDGDGLNCQRRNLRLVTASQNGMNQRKTRGTSIYKGVCWFKRTKRWRAKLKKEGKSIYIGYYFSEFAAAKAYDKKAKELFGEYAKLNFPDQCGIQKN